MGTVTRQQITLSCFKGEESVPVQVAARVCGGLAIHKAINPEKIHRGSYTLTHLTSSVSLVQDIRVPVATQEQLLSELAALMDWTLSYDEICRIWVHNGTVKEAVFSRLRRLH